MTAICEYNALKDSRVLVQGFFWWVCTLDNTHTSADSLTQCLVIIGNVTANKNAKCYEWFQLLGLYESKKERESYFNIFINHKRCKRGKLDWCVWLLSESELCTLYIYCVTNKRPIFERGASQYMLIEAKAVLCSNKIFSNIY